MKKPFQWEETSESKPDREEGDSRERKRSSGGGKSRKSQCGKGARVQMGQGVWGDCSGVCAGQRQGKAARPPLLQGLLCPGEFGLHPLAQGCSGVRGKVSRKEKRDYLRMNQRPFQIPFKLSHRVPFKREEGQLLQNVNVSWGELSKFSSFYALPLGNHPPPQCEGP